MDKPDMKELREEYVRERHRQRLPCAVAFIDALESALTAEQAAHAETKLLLESITKCVFAYTYGKPGLIGYETTPENVVRNIEEDRAVQVATCGEQIRRAEELSNKIKEIERDRESLRQLHIQAADRAIRADAQLTEATEELARVRGRAIKWEKLHDSRVSQLIAAKSRLEKLSEERNNANEELARVRGVYESEQDILVQALMELDAKFKDSFAEERRLNRYLTAAYLKLDELDEPAPEPDWPDPTD